MPGRPRHAAAAVLVVAIGCAGALLVAPSAVAGNNAGQVVEYALPTANSGPEQVAVGSDGNLWFTERATHKVGRITTAGTAAEFALPNGSAPRGIAAGPDGNLWVALNGTNRIARVTTTGTVTTFATPTNNSEPLGIAAGPDGNLWFTENNTNRIGRITTGGTITEFVIPTPNSGPWGIAAGPDGNLWFTESGQNQIGRITTAGAISEFTAAGSPRGIAAGPDGNVWFTEYTGNQLGRITPAGVVSEFPLPTPGSGPAGITTGPDGNLWFTEQTRSRIGRIGTSGTGIVEFAVPSTTASPVGITTGPDGNMWFAETGPDRIATITSGADPALSGPTLSGSGALWLPLVCGVAVWGRPPASTTTAWLRDGVAIPGRTARTYVPTTADLGHRLSCRVTAVLPAIGVPLGAVSRSVAAFPAVAVWAPATVVARVGGTARSVVAVGTAGTYSVRLTTVRNKALRVVSLRARAGANAVAVPLTVRVRGRAVALAAGQYRLWLYAGTKALALTRVVVTR